MNFAVSPVLIPVVKQVRHRHPSTLHLWWARRPLASGAVSSLFFYQELFGVYESMFL